MHALLITPQQVVHVAHLYWCFVLEYFQQVGSNQE
jgi:hypothetical protein